MRGIVTYFVKFPIAANLLMVALLVFGYFGLKNMRSTFFPEVDSRIILVQTVLPGASPEEMEEGVINKIEENLKGVTGIERITSASSENSGVVTIEVLSGYDADEVVDDVRNAVDRIPSFPAGLEPPVVFKRENLGFAIAVAISGDVSLQALKRYARQVETDLLTRDGISKIELSGFPEEEIEIAFRERDLLAYGITFQQAATAVRGANLDITGGTIKTNEEELLLRSRQKEYYAPRSARHRRQNHATRGCGQAGRHSQCTRSLGRQPQSRLHRSEAGRGGDRQQLARGGYALDHRRGEGLCRGV